MNIINAYRNAGGALDAMGLVPDEVFFANLQAPAVARRWGTDAELVAVVVDCAKGAATLADVINTTRQLLGLQ